MADLPRKDQTAPRHRKVVRGRWCFAQFPVRVSVANGSLFGAEDGRRDFFARSTQIIAVSFGLCCKPSYICRVKRMIRDNPE